MIVHPNSGRILAVEPMINNENNYIKLKTLKKNNLKVPQLRHFHTRCSVLVLERCITR